MGGASQERELRDAFIDIIDGKAVKRAKHLLLFNGEDLTPLFIEELQSRGFYPTDVEHVHAAPGERVPAFYVENATAYFGWIFWEQFTSWKLRKLWGSVIKNNRGDWEHQIPSGTSTVVYANEGLKIEMDIDHPPEF
jgi:hypothetical protein